jgi:hypothetical protein
MLEINQRTAFTFASSVDGQNYSFQIFAETREEATKKLLDAMRKIASELEAVLNEKSQRKSS